MFLQGEPCEHGYDGGCQCTPDDPAKRYWLCTQEHTADHRPTAKDAGDKRVLDDSLVFFWATGTRCWGGTHQRVWV